MRWLRTKAWPLVVLATLWLAPGCDADGVSATGPHEASERGATVCCRLGPADAPTGLQRTTAARCAVATGRVVADGRCAERGAWRGALVCCRYAGADGIVVPVRATRAVCLELLGGRVLVAERCSQPALNRSEAPTER